MLHTFRDHLNICRFRSSRSSILLRLFSNTKKGIKLTGLPFKISIDEAIQILHQNEGLFEKDIKDIEGKFSGVLEKAYIPMHSSSIFNIFVTYHVKYGVDRIEWRLQHVGKHIQYVPYTITDWYNLSGKTLSVNYDDCSTLKFHKYADFKFPNDFIEQIVPTVEIKEKCEDVITDGKTIVYTHEKKMSFAIDEILGDVRTFEHERLIEYVKDMKNADHVDIKSMNLMLDDVDIKPFSYHAPVYLYVTTVEGKKICKMINGYNGSYAGDYVVSEMKFTMMGTILGGALGIASLYAFPLTSVGVFGAGIGRIIVLRAGIGGVVSGFLSLFSSKFYSEYKYDKRRERLESDQKINIDHEETLEDVQRKILSRKSISVMYIRYQKEFDILGLDIEEELTIVKLKEARRNKLKQYHPDLNLQSRKETCTILTQQINDSFTILEKVAKE
jgi:hypothetical protein